MRGRVNLARTFARSRWRPRREIPAVCSVSIILFAAILASGGCGTVPADVLALFGDSDTLTVAEYEETYLRLRNTRPETREQKETFLDRLVDFKVKVMEARARGIDRLPEVESEIREYRDKLAVQTVLDERLVGPATRTLYDRRAEEVNFAHILVRWRRFPGGVVDSATTREHAKTILNKALTGEESFDTLIARYSEDGLKRFN
ncbi:MAG: hypothetical protein QHI48_12720, partial [Bacteroidota bacterium]|nr:hypothetical protein [Bacteroidota bacterium]